MYSIHRRTLMPHYEKLTQYTNILKALTLLPQIISIANSSSPNIKSDQSRLAIAPVTSPPRITPLLDYDYKLPPSVH